MFSIGLNVNEIRKEIDIFSQNMTKYMSMYFCNWCLIQYFKLSLYLCCIYFTFLQNSVTFAKVYMFTMTKIASSTYWSATEVQVDNLSPPLK